MLKIEIFGKGCRNCKVLEDNAREAASKLDLEFEIVKVDDIEEITDRGVFKTPGLAVNGKIVSTGKVLPAERIMKFLE